MNCNLRIPHQLRLFQKFSQKYQTLRHLKLDKEHDSDINDPLLRCMPKFLLKIELVALQKDPR